MKQYQVRTRHTREAYHTYAKVHMDARIGGPLARAVAILLGLFILTGGVIAIWQAGFRLLYILSVLVGLLAIFARPLGIFRMTHQLVNNSSDMGMTIDYVFRPDGFTAESPSGVIQASYDEVCKFFETNKYFFVYTSVRMAHILPRADFISGDPAAFPTFLTEKTKVPCVRRPY